MFLKYVTDVSPPEGGREGRGRPSKGAAGQKTKSALRGFKKNFRASRIFQPYIHRAFWNLPAVCDKRGQDHER